MPQMTHRKTILTIVLSAGLLTLASAFIKGSTTITDKSIDHCEQSCRVAAAGLPFPFIADNLSLSPTHSVSVTDALIGIDELLMGALAASYTCWAAIVAIILKLHRLSVKKSST
jgi:hypothetical protein